jgi:hypothetical protein
VFVSTACSASYNFAEAAAACEAQEARLCSENELRCAPTGCEV